MPPELTFDEKVSSWYGLRESSPEKAQRYYTEIVFPEILMRFTATVAEQIAKSEIKRPSVLISQVGLSPEPVIMMIKALAPQRVLFLVSDASQELLARIIPESGLTAGQVQTELIHPSDTLDTYRKIRDYADQMALDGNLVDRLREMAVDITGGKKAMGGGTAMAAGYLSIPAYYLDTELKHHFPVPGSERLVRLSNPVEIFGDLKVKEGIAKFNSADYSGAAEIFRELRLQSAAALKYALFEVLAWSYDDWDNLNFTEAGKKLRQANGMLADVKLCPELKPSVQSNLLAISPLEVILNNGKEDKHPILSSPEKTWALLAFFYTYAQRRETQGKYDMAGLVLYRCLELLSQHLLRYHYGLDTAAVNYDLLKESRNELLKKMNSNYRAMNLREYNSLPPQLTLFNSYVLLKVLKNPDTSQIKLKSLFQGLDTRNHSIFAHGFSKLRPVEYTAFRELVFRVLSEAWLTSAKASLRPMACDGDFAEYCRLYRFCLL